MKETLERYRSRLQSETKADRYAGRFERGSRKRIDGREQRAVRKIFASLKDCQTVLDVPSGAGRFLKSLAGQGRHVIEVDVAFEILQHARKRAETAETKACFVQGDAAKLPLADGAVDGVFCNRLLHHLLSRDERAVILRELRRVARRFVVVSFFDYRSFGRLRKILKAIKGKKPRYNGHPTLMEFQDEVMACGFKVMSIVPTGPAWVSQKYFVLQSDRE